MNDRQRLEAIVGVVCRYLPPDGIPVSEAMSQIIALVDQLPAPVQEPFMWVCNSLNETEWETSQHKECEHCIPLFTTPPAPQPVPVKTYHDGKPWPVAPKPWVGLSRDEVLDIEETTTHPLAFYQAIEAKLKEKNT